jgi:glutamate--cysteine ligase catalytic subunit
VNDRWRIPKSRYASNSTYISEDPRLRPEYLDPDLVIDESIKQQLLDGGMDDRLATHFAHLFIRDPIVIFSEDLQELDLNKTDHFENIQSTNWQHMRFKPPPADNSIGWRVEFRPMEIQITDFENAALSVFMVLITRVVLSYNLNFYIPITKVDENMETAHARDAVLTRKFWFRRNLFPTTRTSRSSASGSSTPTTAGGTSRPPTPTGPVEDEYRLMTVNEIINGTAYAKATTPTTTSSPHDDEIAAAAAAVAAQDEEDDFPGLIPLVESYLDSVNVDVVTRCELATYLDLIRKRASGELWTAAKWIRHFVAAHPEYKRDSVVGDAITKDLVAAVIRVGEREAKGEKLRGLCGGGGDGVPGLEGLLGGFR